MEHTDQKRLRGEWVYFSLEFQAVEFLREGRAGTLTLAVPHPQLVAVRHECAHATCCFILASFFHSLHRSGHYPLSGAAYSGLGSSISIKNQYNTDRHTTNQADLDKSSIEILFPDDSSLSLADSLTSNTCTHLGFFQNKCKSSCIIL